MKMSGLAADSILQGEGEPILRRHERGCVLRGSGRAYHGVTRDSVSLMAAGEPITAARVIRYLSCHEERLHHDGKRAYIHRGNKIAARDRVLGGLWSCPGWVCGHLLGLPSSSGSWSVVMSWGVLSSSLGSAFISWIVGCGHVLDGSVVISWVCGRSPGSVVIS